MDWLQKYYSEVTDGELSNLQDNVIIVGTCPGTHFRKGPILGYCPKLHMAMKDKCQACWKMEIK